MRKLLLGLAATLALAIASPAGAATVTVRIFSASFSPSSTTIREGDTVTWVNRASANHQVVADNGSFASPILKPSQSYSQTFTKAGTVHYHDALRTGSKGTVVVRAAPAAVTLASSATQVTYGGQITLTGAVSSKNDGETVTIFSQPYPQASFVQLATVLTTTGGAWDYITKPGVLTSYEVRFKTATSSSVTVEVSPRIVLTTKLTPTRRIFFTHVYGGVSFAGRSVSFQRLSSVGQWVTLRKLLLGSASGRLFSIMLPKGVSRVRVAMSVNQAGSGYLGAFSPVLLVRRR